MKRASEPLLSLALPLGTALAAALVWQATVRLAGIPQVILPAPTDIGGDLFGQLPLLLRHAAVSGSEAVLAFLGAVVAGFAAAAAISSWPTLRDVLYPNIVALQLTPKVALAPLFVIWLGIDTPARVTFAAFLSFFPILISTAVGLRNTDPNAIRLCRSLGATDWRIFWSVRVPFALPQFFSGVRIAVTMAVTGIVIAEFVTAQEGLGYVILTAGSRSETAGVFAAILMLCFVGLILYGLVAALERLAARWYRG